MEEISLKCKEVEIHSCSCWLAGPCSLWNLFKLIINPFSTATVHRKGNIVFVMHGENVQIQSVAYPASETDTLGKETYNGKP